MYERQPPSVRRSGRRTDQNTSDNVAKPENMMSNKPMTMDTGINSLGNFISTSQKARPCAIAGDISS
jgi:hypothetical protein